ncbi:heme NO-binding domain-containing protein [Paracoccus sp. (in: a-proteobacteria)]|uniref:heme NO-binding domain-containing protein n=1 Tax=Paracoccus sp. TaxID=267 RepID=UPI0035ADCAAE
MHEFASRAIEKFLHDEAIHRVEAGLLSPGQMLQDAAAQSGKPLDELTEDLGAWLVQQHEIWRLLRFCGSDFLDFLLHLDELPERIRLIADDVDVPDIALSRSADGLVWVTVSGGPPGWDALLAGLLRAMADDYGTLCVITRGTEGICIDVSDSAFAEARTFHLSSRARPA